ncbi:MAG: hypothetical protein KJ601_06235 [Nanoarchaeota archaeon]|nr:hypothetical protein [Nanoarchaeota archaeon]MBU1704116.1 hypothetical protein [Nanoarchaeota archaeon]
MILDDITFNLGITPEEGLPILTAQGSPFELYETFDDYHILKARSAAFTEVFMYGSTDRTDLFGEDPDKVHSAAAQALQFSPASSLYYAYPNFDFEGQGKLDTLNQMMAFFAQENIPFYLTARTEEGFQTLVRGHNPLTGAEIVNDRLRKDLQPLPDDPSSDRLSA